MNLTSHIGIPEEALSWRIKPGGLSVSRTLGYSECKLREKGAVPEVITAEPEVKVIDIDAQMDFVILGTHGIFDYNSPERAVELVWSSIHKLMDQKDESAISIQEMLSEATKDLIQESILHGSEENLSVLIVLFPSSLSLE